MTMKTTLQGFLIYAAMLGYVLALWLYWLKKYELVNTVYAIGIAVALAAVGYRWMHTGHAPCMNLFEIFLCMGAMYPLICFGGGLMRIGSRAYDMVVGILLLFAAGFVFDAEPRNLPPALQHFLFLPHVSAYLLAYIYLVKAGLVAVFGLIRGAPLYGKQHSGDEIYKLVRNGFPCMTMGLVLGSWWAKMAWGEFWSWDPKELWSLAAFLVYAGYLHVHAGYGKRYPRIKHGLVFLGFLLILATLLWANLSDLFLGLHDYANLRGSS